jgi:hypothetical protein
VQTLEPPQITPDPKEKTQAFLFAALTFLCSGFSLVILTLNAFFEHYFNLSAQGAALSLCDFHQAHPQTHRHSDH